jgi:hypothetical protein
MWMINCFGRLAKITRSGRGVGRGESVRKQGGGGVSQANKEKRKKAHGVHFSYQEVLLRVVKMGILLTVFCCGHVSFSLSIVKIESWCLGARTPSTLRHKEYNSRPGFSQSQLKGREGEEREEDKVGNKGAVLWSVIG